jgi:cytochrome b pre-mRNA-processing protein 3
VWLACARPLELPVNARDMAAMSLLTRLFAPKPDVREDLRPLWNAVVAEARSPAFYRAGVADSVQGRFDMVCAVMSAVLLRMERSEPLIAPSVMLTELFVHDMDGQLREFGIGDMIVGKHIGKLVSAMGGRLGAYREGLAGGDDALTDAVRRNVTLEPEADAGTIAASLRSLAERLERTDDAALLAGSIAS